MNEPDFIQGTTDHISSGTLTVWSGSIVDLTCVTVGLHNDAGVFYLNVTNPACLRTVASGMLQWADWLEEQQKKQCSESQSSPSPSA